ncbi:hypothetical protein B0A48_04174 [Cryoendolithus antarcticus]|uniref:Uncharacterized protein n=1 Tax=Cryoendolithus antarcticus TaxID=1507870 RepID=A0A1V8THL0_9PEZI|nr:hypothetical protein B0A48_04174 [Cryoendolithus antarcticus]
MSSWCGLGSSHDTHLTASSAITALSTTSSEDALSNWYGVTLPIGRQQAVKLPSGRQSATTFFTVVIEDIYPTPLLSDLQTKLFVLRPGRAHSRICFPIGTVYSKCWGIFNKTTPTQYIFVKDVSNDTYWIMLDAVTGKHPWCNTDYRTSRFGSIIDLACAELQSAWPTVSRREFELACGPLGFSVGGVRRNSSSLLESGLLEDHFNEDEYHRLASEYADEISKLRRPPKYALDDDSVLSIMQLLGLTTRADASRFIHRSWYGPCWWGHVNANTLFHDASQLSNGRATFYGLQLLASKIRNAPNAHIIVNRDLNRSHSMTLSRGRSLIGYEDDAYVGQDPDCYVAQENPPPPFDNGRRVPNDSSLVAISLVGDKPHITMPLGLLRLHGKTTRFMLVKDVSGDARKYMILFNASYQRTCILENDIDYPQIIRPARRKAYIEKGEKRFTAMEVDFEGVDEDGQVTFTETGIYRHGYHIAPVALVDDKLIHPGDLPPREGQAVWLSGRWSRPPAPKLSRKEKRLRKEKLSESRYLYR